MKRHLLALLTFLTSLTFASEVLGQTYRNMDNEVVPDTDVKLEWPAEVGGFTTDGQTVGVGQALPNPPRMTIAADSGPTGYYPNTYRRVMNVYVKIEVSEGGGTVTDSAGKIGTPGQPLITQSDEVGDIFFRSWVVGPNPGVPSLTATVVLDENGTEFVGADVKVLFATAVILPPEEDASERHDQRRTLTTDTTIRVIDGINNNLRRHLETLRRRQPE